MFKIVDNVIEYIPILKIATYLIFNLSIIVARYPIVLIKIT